MYAQHLLKDDFRYSLPVGLRYLAYAMSMAPPAVDGK
jgi:hypothetical protein